MELKNILCESIEKIIKNEGIDIELSNNFNCKLFNLNKEIENNNANLLIDSNVMNNRLLLSVFLDMIKNDEVDISFNSKTSKHNKNYLNKLIKESV